MSASFPTPPDGSVTPAKLAGSPSLAADQGIAWDGSAWVAVDLGAGGGGAVASVNGATGVVVLGAADVGADVSGAAAAAAAASQPLDSDLSAIAALSTTAYGRALLALADAAAGRTALGLGSAATSASSAFEVAGAAAAAQAASQPLDSDLTAIAALTTTSFGRAFLGLADAAAGRTALGLGTAATQASTAFDAAGAAAAVQGLPLGLTGATSATRYVGATTSGAPASGTFAVGDFSIDRTGKVYICTTAGSPGTWTLSGGSSAPTIVAGGNLGATRSQTVAANGETWLTGTLTANHTLTLTLGTGARLRLFGTQDGTGSRTLTVSDGTTTQAVTIPMAAGASFEVDFYSADGTTIFINSGGSSAASGVPFTPVGTIAATDVQTAVAEVATDAIAREAALAPLASPTFTGTPAAPTATARDNSTKLATTAYVDAADSIVTANTQTASYTLVLTDAGKTVEQNSASATVLTIPPNSSVAFPVGTVLEVCRLGAGSVTITPGSGVTIPNRLEAAGTTSRTLSSQYSSASLRKRATDVWVLVGDIA